LSALPWRTYVHNDAGTIMLKPVVNIARRYQMLGRVPRLFVNSLHSGPSTCARTVPKPHPFGLSGVAI
jgi:hypothetical protein